ncbi:MAG: helix-turn-helix domain-containing protein [Pseudomonadota bacterium]
MARPRAFDTDAALEAATALFWERGYEGAGLADLLDAMGIQRGSLYKAWGSKKALFLACLDHYDRRLVDPGLAFLRGEGEAAALSGAERLAAVFENHDPRGCLLCNSAAGIAGVDDDIAHRVKEGLDRIRGAFEAALADDRPGAESAAGVAEDAERLLQRYMGFRVQQRTER